MMKSQKSNPHALSVVPANAVYSTLLVAIFVLLFLVDRDRAVERAYAVQRRSVQRGLAGSLGGRAVLLGLQHTLDPVGDFLVDDVVGDVEPVHGFGNGFCFRVAVFGFFGNSDGHGQ